MHKSKEIFKTLGLLVLSTMPAYVKVIVSKYLNISYVLYKYYKFIKIRNIDMYV